jgi:hypothetical protein
MAEMGIVLKPSEESRKRKGKGKAREMPSGHVVFVDDRAECECSVVHDRGLIAYLLVDQLHESHTRSEDSQDMVKSEEAPDLGWEVAGPRRKKKEQGEAVKPEVDEEELQEEARVSLPRWYQSSFGNGNLAPTWGCEK